MATYLFIPGFPGKSSAAGHSGEAELLSFHLVSPYSGGGGAGRVHLFDVTLETYSNSGFIDRLLWAGKHQTLLPLVWVSYSATSKIMFWKVKVLPDPSNLDGNQTDGSSFFTFDYEGSVGYKV